MQKDLASNVCAVLETSGKNIIMFPDYEQGNIRVRRSLKTDRIRLKPEDVQEVYYSHDLKPDEAIKMSLDKSIVAMTVLMDGKPEILFGINPVSLLGSHGVVWMLSSERIKDINIRFARHCRQYIDWFLKFYPVLFNYVSVENKTSIIWLKKLGAKFESPVNYGVHNKLFRRFEFTR